MKFGFLFKNIKIFLYLCICRTSTYFLEEKDVLPRKKEDLSCGDDVDQNVVAILLDENPGPSSNAKLDDNSEDLQG